MLHKEGQERAAAVLRLLVVGHVGLGRVLEDVDVDLADPVLQRHVVRHYRVERHKRIAVGARPISRRRRIGDGQDHIAEALAQRADELGALQLLRMVARNLLSVALLDAPAVRLEAVQVHKMAARGCVEAETVVLLREAAVRRPLPRPAAVAGRQAGATHGRRALNALTLVAASVHGERCLQGLLQARRVLLGRHAHHAARLNVRKAAKRLVGGEILLAEDAAAPALLGRPGLGIHGQRSGIHLALVIVIVVAAELIEQALLLCRELLHDGGLARLGGCSASLVGALWLLGIGRTRGCSATTSSGGKVRLDNAACGRIVREELLQTPADLVKEERLDLGVALVLELKDAKVVRAVRGAEGGDLREDALERSEVGELLGDVLGHAHTDDISERQVTMRKSSSSARKMPCVASYGLSALASATSNHESSWKRSSIESSSRSVSSSAKAAWIEEEVLVEHDAAHRIVAVVMRLGANDKAVAHPHVAADLGELDADAQRIVECHEELLLVDSVLEQLVETLLARPLLERLVAYERDLTEQLGQEPVHWLVEADGLRLDCKRDDGKHLGASIGADAVASVVEGGGRVGLRVTYGEMLAGCADGIQGAKDGLHELVGRSVCERLSKHLGRLAEVRADVEDGNPHFALELDVCRDGAPGGMDGLEEGEALEEVVGVGACVGGDELLDALGSEKDEVHDVGHGRRRKDGLEEEHELGEEVVLLDEHGCDGRDTEELHGEEADRVLLLAVPEHERLDEHGVDLCEAERDLLLDLAACDERHEERLDVEASRLPELVLHEEKRLVVGDVAWIEEFGAHAAGLDAAKGLEGRKEAAGDDVLEGGRVRFERTLAKERLGRELLRRRRPANVEGGTQSDHEVDRVEDAGDLEEAAQVGGHLDDVPAVLVDALCDALCVVL
ncbi:hypothetical protein L1887_52108 [Cichorium endivia]|nr:hypothetical protein L1887_52108 [Cichorium endivia]